MSTETNSSGKVNAQLFKDLIFDSCGASRKDVITGPQFGVDTAIIDLGANNALAVSSDPLSLIPSLGLRESAWLSVHLLVNDMATTGHAPQFAQFVLNLPVSFSNTDFKTYWQYIHQFCSELNIAITGGHTGRVPGQESTICGGGTMFLHAPKDKILTSNKAQPGDAIIMTKESALSSTAILAKIFPKTLRKELGHKLYKQAVDNFYKTSSLKEAILAANYLENKQNLHAMHDVTEGGIIGALCEMALASHCGFQIESDRICVGAAQEKITAFFGIDHRYCIGSGSMLMSVNPEVAEELINHLKENGIAASVLGNFTAKEHTYEMIENGASNAVVYDGRDPYWDAFYRAIENGMQ